MNMWLAILLLGLGSYVLRAVPLLLSEHIRLSQELDATLRHAAVGAMTALLVLGAMRVAATPSSADAIAVGLALACSLTLGFSGRSMLLVVVSGGVVYGATLSVLRVLVG